MPYQSERSSSYKVRAGKDVPEFGGMNTRHDPSALPPSQFQELVNTRFKGGRIINRKGVQKINTLAMTGTPTGSGGNDYGYFDGDGGYVAPGAEFTPGSTPSSTVWETSPLTGLYLYLSMEGAESGTDLGQPGLADWGFRDYSGQDNHYGATTALGSAPQVGGVAGTYTVDIDGGNWMFRNDDDFWMGSSTSFSLQMWIRPSRVNVAQYVWNRGMGGAAGLPDWYLWIDASNRVTWERYKDTDVTLYAISGGAVQLNQWTHVVVTHDADASRGCLYTDTAQYSSGSFAPDVPQASASGLTTPIAAYASHIPSYYYGRIDEIALWRNRVLTPGEVLWLNNGGNGRTYADLAAV